MPPPDATNSVPSDFTVTRDPDGTADHDPDRTASHIPAGPPAAFDGLEELGRGAMGVVYKAMQPGLNRPVAVKMLLGEAADPKLALRFLAEAEAVAAIDHPHVVRVFEFGRRNGKPFLAMEYLPGGTLSDQLASRAAKPREALPTGLARKTERPEDSAKLLHKLALGVSAAHAAGIVHRDLKPGNVLFDAAGEPKVTDFGLAKRSTGADLTRTEAWLGTPAYMSPEQAKGEGKFVGPPADVWALGVILYECLTGKRPFDATDTWQLMQQVIGTEPAGVRSVCADVPRDLDLIVHKCLRKEPGERYPSAAELADDLRRYLAGEPIRARPVPGVVRAWKWAKRNRAVAAGIFGTVFALAAGAAVSSALAFREAAQATLARTREGEAVTALRAAETARTEAEAARTKEASARTDAEAARDKARASAVRMYRDRGFLAFDQGNAGEGLLWHARALADLPADARADRDELLHNGAAWAARTAPIRWVVRTLTPVRGVAITADGRRVAVGSEGGVQLFDGETGVPLTGVNGTGGWPLRLAFSPDGTRLVSTHRHKGVQLWDGVTGRPFGRMISLPKIEGCPPCFAPGGKWFVVEEGSRLHRLSAADGSPVGDPWPVDAGQGWVWSLAFSPDGTRLAVGQTGVSIVDAATGQTTVRQPGPLNNTHGLAFLPDGQAVVGTTWSGNVFRWNLSADEPVTPFSLGGQGLQAATLADGSVLTASANGRVYRYEPSRGMWSQPVVVRHSFRDMAADATGRRLVVHGPAYTVRAYQLPATPHGDTTWSAPAQAASVGGDRVALVNAGRARVTDAATGRTEVVLPDPADPANVELSADGRVALVVGKTAARFWDATTGRPLSDLIPLNSDGGTRAVVAADGRQAAVWGKRGENSPTLLDAATGTARALTPAKKPNRPGNRGQIVFGTDGRAVFAAGEGTQVTRWDTATGAAQLSAFRDNTVFSLAAGGEFVALGSSLSYVELYRQSDVQKFGTIPFPGEATALAFDAAGRRLLVGGRDRTVRMFDPESRQPIGPPWPGHRGQVAGVEFHPAGRLALSYDSTAVWVRDTRTGRPVGPPRALARPFTVGFASPPDRLVVGSHGAVYSFDIPPPLPDDAARLRLWIAVHFGIEVSDQDAVEELSADDWYARWVEWEADAKRRREPAPPPRPAR